MRVQHPEVVADACRLRVYLVAEVRLYRETLGAALDSSPGLLVVGAGAADEPTVKDIETRRVDVALVDSASTRGTDLVRRIAALSPATRILAIAVREQIADILECAQSGADGYVGHDATLEDLAGHIQTVHRGELVCSPRVAALMFHHVAELATRHDTSVLTPLTGREQEIVLLIGRGLSNKEIARWLSIEVATVKSHVHHILEKLGVRRRSAVAARLRDGHDDRDAGAPDQPTAAVAVYSPGTTERERTR